jgi:Uncharacterized protein conserved in bacteria (DUF2219)
VRPTILLLALVLVGASPLAQADEPSSVPVESATHAACAPATGLYDEASAKEPSGLGAGLVFDEHVLTNGSHDQDYDGGGEVTLSGERSGALGRTLDKALGFIDEAICPRTPAGTSDWQTAHAFALGLIMFTPNDLAARNVVYGDRPYASLFFLSAGRRYASPTSDVAYDSTLTVGALGLPAAESVQSLLHRLTDSTHPEGWSHQISAGGEPTARYALARQELLGEYGGDTWRGDAKWTAAGSVGTVTEGSLALNARWGHSESPWSAFVPEQTMYVRETQPEPPPLPEDASPEVFAFAGVRAKLRAYNAFLQGQFRHSDLAYGEDQLNQLLGEAWAGVEMRTSSGWSVQYAARWESPELRSGIGSRSLFWGSIEIAKSLR